VAGALGSRRRGLVSRDWRRELEVVVDDLLEGSPELARYAGDHRHDSRLPDYSEDAVRRQRTRLREDADALASIDEDDLDVEERVDRELLASAVDARLFELDTIREHEWNPLLHNPGDLLFGLLARDFAPAGQRLAAVLGRLSAVPDAAQTASDVLGECPRVHVETALTQLEGTRSLIREQVPALLDQLPGRGSARLQREVETASTAALTALGLLGDRLLDRLGADGEPGRSPRLGRRSWEARLWHTLDSDLSAATVLARAQAHLAEVSEQLRETARELTGSDDVRAALDALARNAPDAYTIVGLAGEALASTTGFVREHDLLSVPDDPLEIVEMPEFARGVSVAYCDAPGPLEPASVPTFFAIAPAPASWPPERVTSFYREYNDHMVANLTVHEAMPGHHLQLAAARRFRGSTRARAVCSSGSFVEGWAVYAEQLLAEAGYGGLAVRMQQLKMQLRMTLNAILDQLVHCEDLSEAEGMALMTGSGFAEEGEAAGKWRRALLTSTQLSTYFVGYLEVSALAAGRTDRAARDELLAHGSPSPRHLRTLLAGS